MKSNAEVILLAIKAVNNNYSLDDDVKVEVIDCILDAFWKEDRANDIRPDE